MKRLFISFLVFACLVSAEAQTNDPTHLHRKKVGVVLGGGGAKGAAHIGALKYIEDMGIPVDYVAGTSMGSIIGGLYAMGYSPDQLTQLIRDVNWSEYIGNKISRPLMSKEMRQRNSTLLLNVPFSLQSLFDNDPKTKLISQLPSAYVNNSSLINLFNDLCVGYQEEMDFNDLPIPFACVATDMVSGDEVVLHKGSAPTAMRASMAIPGVFSPVPMGDMVLVDGGLVNNFPADVLKEMGADIIIGVEITSNKEITSEDLQSLPQVFGRLVANSTSGKREENRKLCNSDGNVYMVPDVSGYGMLSFTHEAIDTLVGRGYKKASEFHDQLLQIKREVENSAGGPVGKTLYAQQAKNLAVDSVMVRSFSINNVSDAQSRWLVRKGGLKADKKYTQNDIENAMNVYRGTGCFDEITYNVKEADSLHQTKMLEGIYDLSVNMKPAKPHAVGLGLRYDTEEGAGLLLNIGLNAKKFGGIKFNANAKLSYNPKVNLTFTYSAPSVANFNLAYDYRNEHFRLLTEPRKGINLHYRQQKASFYISQFHILNLSTEVGLSFTSTTFDKTSMGADNILDSIIFVHNMQLTPYISVEYDNLDDAYFAKRGAFVNTTARYHIEPNYLNKCLDLSLAVQGYITPCKGRVTIIPQMYFRYVTGATECFNMWNIYGGEIAGRHFEQQMPFIGLTTTQYALDIAGVLRCDVRYNFYGKHYITAMYNILGVVDNYGDSAHAYFDTQGAGLKYSYKSPLGPISLAGYWVMLEGQHMPGVYFSFGYTF